MDLETVVRQVLVVGLAWGSSAAFAAPSTRYLTVINDDDRTIQTVEISPADTATFEPMALPSPLVGGRTGQATVAVPDGACPRNLRVIYRDNTVLTISNWNVCRQAVLHVGAARLTGMRQRHPA